jgi:hypothetical protein
LAGFLGLRDAPWDFPIQEAILDMILWCRGSVFKCLECEWAGGASGVEALASNTGKGEGGIVPEQTRE